MSRLVILGIGFGAIACSSTTLDAERGRETKADAGRQAPGKGDASGPFTEPAGPPVCHGDPSVEPLDPGCVDSVCHVAIRLDYVTLDFRGHAVLGGAASSVDVAGAREAARTVFDANGTYLSPEISMSGPRSGLFTAFVSPADSGAFALVGVDSGAVVAAGGVDWAGRGEYWIPARWKPAADVRCGEGAAVAEETYAYPGSCDGYGIEVKPAAAGQALDVALRTNLAAHVAAKGPFSAFAYLYTPTVGGCDPSVAEYLVVLSQKQ